ncbi:MAG: VTT domain-containing protein [Clostridia bacterium]|nr:VTT domain-containing protein [Clostridia bacterium]
MQQNETFINLLVTVDKNYLSPLCTMLRSYIDTNEGVPTELYVAHSLLDEEDFARLEDECEGSCVRIHNVRIRERHFSDIPVLERLPEESFYRLLAFDFLPKEVERCLYLDPDILVLGELSSFYETDLSEHYIAASGHLHGFRDGFNKMRLHLGEQERYINSGVMLLNLAAIRRDFTVKEILEVMEENVRALLMGDQDMVNILFGKRTLFVPEEVYNLDERTFRDLTEKEGWTLATVRERTRIIHYNGKCKPWLAGYEGMLDMFYPSVERKGPRPTGVAARHVRSFLRITRPSRAQTVAICSLALFALVCILSYVFFGQELLALLAEPEAFRAWLDGFGAADELIFILIRAAQTMVKFIPAEPLEIGAGFAYGAVPGMLYCLLGNMLGTIPIFFLTKKFGMRLLSLFFSKRSVRRFSAFFSGEKLYGLIFFFFLIPGSPKDGVTYFIGLTDVKLLPFLALTFFARIPSILTSTICGSALAEKQYLFSALVFLVTILLALGGGALYAAVAKRRAKKKEE